MTEETSKPVEYDNTNKGVLFKNTWSDHPDAPQYRGSLNVKGEEYYVSAWIKSARKSGSKFMSFIIEPKNGAKPAAPKNQLTEDNWATAEFNDEIPF